MYSEIKDTFELLATAPTLKELKQGIETCKEYFKETCKKYNQPLAIEIEKDCLLIFKIDNKLYEYKLSFK